MRSAVLLLALPACAAVPLPPEACAYLADAAIVARAEAVEGVSVDQSLRVTARIYTAEQAADLIAAITAVAHRDRRPVREYARAVFDACLSGRLEQILGAPS